MQKIKKPTRANLYKQSKALAKKLKLNQDDYKKLYRKSTSAFWISKISELNVIDKQRQSKIIPIKDIHYRGYESYEKLVDQNTLKYLIKIHTLKQDIALIPTNLKLINSQLLHVVKMHPVYKDDTTMYKIVVESDDGRHISTPAFKKASSAVKFLMDTHLRPKSRAYTDGDFIISKIHFTTVKSNTMCGYTASQLEANAKYYIHDPIKARTSCVYHSLTLCRNYPKNPELLTDNKKLVESARNLKKKCKDKLTKKVGCDNDTIQIICNYLKTPIRLYNFMFDEIKYFTPATYHFKHGTTEKYFHNDIDLLEIQRIGNHCVALIPKAEIKKRLPKFDLDGLMKKAEPLEVVDSLISKKYVPHTFNKNIASFDIETSKDVNGVHVPYACSIAWMGEKEGKNEDENEDELKEKQFWGLDCMVKFLEFIHQEYFSGFVLYAHNGGKYDVNLMLRYGLAKQDQWQINGKSCIELNSAWIGFEIMDKIQPKFKIIFRDSCRILPMSLEKLCIEMDVKHKKLKETVNHDQITLDNYMTFPQLPKYLTHDVFGLLESMLKFNKQVYDDLEIDVTKCYTGASLSKSNFFRNYYQKNKYPVFTLTNEHDKFIRDGYCGGRVECFKMGAIGKCYYYDFTSLYPAVARQHLPYGKPKEIKFNNCSKLEKKFFGFVKCLVKTKDSSRLGKHAIIRDSRLIFPVFENWTEINCFSMEIDYDIYEYQFIEGLKFDKGTFLSRFFTDAFNKKAEAKADGLGGLAQAYKIIANSGYGFWGIRTQNRDGVIISNTEDKTYLKYLNSEKLVDVKENVNGTMFCRVIKDLQIKDFNVGVASAISSYARLRLQELLQDIQDLGGSVSYCDTDSVICNINLNDYPELKEKYQWDGNGVELGSLKNECDEVIEKHIKKRLAKITPDALKKILPGGYNYNKKLMKDVQLAPFHKMVKHEVGNLSFDNCIITGCKQYAMKKKFYLDGEVQNVEILKLKGYSQANGKLRYEDYEHMTAGGVVQQLQTQFRCPRSNYVSLDDTEHFSIKSVNVSKRFRAIYNKGTVKYPELPFSEAKCWNTVPLQI